ncbi:MAG: DUF5320 domain-containing protein [Halobacteriota archaeon]
MPGFDRTGPVGCGPMTGRRQGPCMGSASRRFVDWRSPMLSKGGRSRGFRWRYHATGLPRGTRTGPFEDVHSEVDKATIKETLEEEVSLLEDELSKIKMRLEELRPEESNRDEQ